MAARLAKNARTERRKQPRAILLLLCSTDRHDSRRSLEGEFCRVIGTRGDASTFQESHPGRQLHAVSRSRNGETVAPSARVSEGPRPLDGRRRRRPIRSALVTSSPDVAAPGLICPECDRPLIYLHTVLRGVKPPERWDYVQCVPCGFFEYRSRTRRLRQTPQVPDVRRAR